MTRTRFERLVSVPGMGALVDFMEQVTWIEGGHGRGVVSAPVLGWVRPRAFSSYEQKV